MANSIVTTGAAYAATLPSADSIVTAGFVYVVRGPITLPAGGGKVAPASRAANTSSSNARTGNVSGTRRTAQPQFSPQSILDAMDNTVGYVQWRAFVGPLFRENTDSDFFDWSALTLSAYTPIADTTTSTNTTAVATTVDLTDASSFPSEGGLWIGPNATGESWGYATYTGKSGNQLTGLTRDTVDAEYTGVHTSGAVARFWWELDTATAEPVLREMMDNTFSSVFWELTLEGIVAPIPALRANHLCLVQKRELSGGSWGSWTNWLIGWVKGHSNKDDASKNRPWSLQVTGLNGILMEKEATGLRVGPPDIADNANITVSSTLSPAYKEANTGEFTGSNPDISEQALVDNDTSSPWISGGFVGSDDDPGSSITQVHVANYPGQSDGYRWIEISVTVDIVGERNLGVAVDYFVVFKDSYELNYSAGDTIILAENKALFESENPENKATATLDLADYQLWNYNNNKQTVDLNGATGGTFTLTWNRSGSGWSSETTGSLNWNATAQEVTDAFDALTQLSAESVFVTGNDGGPFSITFVRDQGSTSAIATLVVNSSLTGGGTPIVTVDQAGGSAFDTTNTADTLFDYIDENNGILRWLQLNTDVQQIVAWGTTYSIWAQDLTQGLGGGANHLWSGALLTAPTAGQTMRRTTTPAAIADDTSNWDVSSVATPGYKMVAYDAGPPEVLATKEWIYFDLPTMGLSLSADIDNAVTTIVIAKQDEPNVDGLPASGTIQVGIEQITYTSIDRSTGTISGGARGANSTTAVVHLSGDTVYFVNSGVATEAYPIDTIEIERPSGFSVPEDFVIYGSELVIARTPDEESYTNDYTTYATVTANASTSYSLDLSATAPRIRYLLIEITKMSEQPSRVKVNELRVLVDGDVMNSDNYLASGTVATAMSTLLQGIGIPAGAITDNGDTQTVTEYTTQTDLLWSVLVDLAEFTNSRITVGRDSKLTLQSDPFWGVSGTPSESSEFTRTEAAHVEYNKTPARNVGQVEMKWRLVDSETEDTASFPSSYTTGRNMRIGPYVYADSTAATAGATKRYYQLRRPYDVMVELAQQGDTIRAGSVRGLNWQLHDDQLAQNRTYMCVQSSHTIIKFGWNTVLTLLQLNRTDEL